MGVGSLRPGVSLTLDKGWGQRHGLNRSKYQTRLWATHAASTKPLDWDGPVTEVLTLANRAYLETIRLANDAEQALNCMRPSAIC